MIILYRRDTDYSPFFIIDTIVLVHDLMSLRSDEDYLYLVMPTPNEIGLHMSAAKN